MGNKCKIKYNLPNICELLQWLTHFESAKPKIAIFNIPDFTPRQTIFEILRMHLHSEFWRIGKTKKGRP